MINLNEPWITKPLTPKQKQILIILLQDAGFSVYHETALLIDHESYPCLTKTLSSSGYNVVGNTGRNIKGVTILSYEELFEHLKNKESEKD